MAPRGVPIPGRVALRGRAVVGRRQGADPRDVAEDLEGAQESYTATLATLPPSGAALTLCATAANEAGVTLAHEVTDFDAEFPDPIAKTPT